MPYELCLSGSAEWRDVTKTEANKRIACHYLRERMSALYKLIDAGMLLDCDSHGVIRRRRGRW